MAQHTGGLKHHLQVMAFSPLSEHNTYSCCSPRETNTLVSSMSINTNNICWLSKGVFFCAFFLVSLFFFFFFVSLSLFWISVLAFIAGNTEAVLLPILFLDGNQKGRRVFSLVKLTDTYSYNKRC